jgi:hypothetical protein
VSRDDAVSECVTRLVKALEEDLSREDREGGWTESRRSWYLTFMTGFQEGWISRGPDATKALSAHHLARWLDNEGLIDSPLGDRFVQLQRALQERL